MSEIWQDGKEKCPGAPRKKKQSRSVTEPRTLRPAAVQQLEERPMVIRNLLNAFSDSADDARGSDE